MKVYYEFFINDKKIGEYTENTRDLEFHIAIGISLDDAISASNTLAKNFKKPVNMIFASKMQTVQYQKNN